MKNHLLSKTVKVTAKKQKKKENGISHGKSLLLVFLTLVFMVSMLQGNMLFVKTAQAAVPGQVVLTVKQVFSIGSLYAPPNKTVAYRLVPKTVSAPMPDGSDSRGYTFTMTGTEEVNIKPINFYQTGNYTYELSCLMESKNGYTYDRQVYNIEVYVLKDLKTYSVVYINDGVKASEIHFEHIYGTLPSRASDMHDVNVVKTISGNPDKKEIFSFQLTPEKPENPMPAGSKNGIKSLRITGAGKGKFGTWGYDREGVYHYKVSEVNTGIYGYTYDTTVYTITDEVKNINGRLKVTRDIQSETDKHVMSFSFVNIYQYGNPHNLPPNHPLNRFLPKTGDWGKPEFWITLMAINIVFLLIVLLWVKKKNKKKK